MPVRSAIRHLTTNGRLRGWVAAAAIIAIAGTLASVLGARSIAHADHDKARLNFHLASSQIGSALTLAIQHEEDLVLSAGAFIASNPHAPATAFERWTEAVQPLHRYPELQGVGLVQTIPASQLGAFAEQVERQAPGTAFALEPIGKRPYYCLVTAYQHRSLAAPVPPGHDYCAFAPTLLDTRDSGTATYVGFAYGHEDLLAVEIPVYRAHATLATVLERQSAFIGWLGELLTPRLVLMRAAAGHPNVAVTFTYTESPTKHIPFTVGTIARHAESTSINLHNGWTVRTSQPVTSGAIVHDDSALGALIAGTILSLAAAALLLVLATSRGRALALVEEKTRELSHIAMHDPLTGLPNRALAMDRATQLLAKVARRTELGAAALFIDLDGFKQVNDCFGHAAGDQLLQAVAKRLQEGVREQDTVARLGGDEFVVFVESPMQEDTARVLARRLSAALRQPIELQDGLLIDTITASIGIAEGRYVTPDALLRDADLALYAAKGGGKDRYAVFVPSDAGPETSDAGPEPSDAGPETSDAVITSTPHPTN
jgi:diguanylate cyclase (GGDEF)-like protein